jgi:hypothetical protein
VTTTAENATEQAAGDIRYWLANEDWYPSAYTRAWLERTPPDVAADILAQIAEDADLEARSSWSIFLMIFAVAGFSPSNAIAGKHPDDLKAGIRAALLLAGMNDARAIPPLVRVYETDSLRQSKYQEKIEPALTRVLNHVLSAANDHEIHQYADDIRQLTARAWGFGGGRRELPPGTTELLLTALRWLGRSRTEGDARLLRFIAASQGRKPNRIRVKEVTDGLLNSQEEYSAPSPVAEVLPTRHNQGR